MKSGADRTRKVYAVGQRYVSRTEPELGLGTVTALIGRHVQISFDSGNTIRRYDRDNAPVHRGLFRQGDTIVTRKAQTLVVDSVEEGPVVSYRCATAIIAETDIDDRCAFSGPARRLSGGIVDSTELFDNRLALLRAQAAFRSSPWRGFTGGRIDLLGHQLFIAHTVSSRAVVRALLCDETGLGKTIEACLIVQRLVLTGRATRVLFVVPSALIHQWFVELLRRFNLSARLLTAEFCEGWSEQENPFAVDQIGIISLEFLEGSPRRSEQAVAAGWDLVVVDEAHHVQEKSRGYALLGRLAPLNTGLLLLTATPEQLGRRGHFARLHLLDPMRYTDFARYEAESARFTRLSQTIEQMCSAKGVDPAAADSRALVLGANKELAVLLEQDPASIASLTLEQLIDRYGIGRVLFRNTRTVVGGFAERYIALEMLDAPQADCARIDRECRADWIERGPVHDLPGASDPRMVWAVQLLRTISEEKVLIMCTTRGKAMAVQTALTSLIRIDIALFHEDLTILQRDRAAAWFADPAGARVLVCSENGSEGRNFQFCHHLVLFDLPLEPEVLEQRIGRLDRIGQRQTIHIHIPYVKGSAQEVLCRWYHEGVNAFAVNARAASRVQELTRKELLACAFAAGEPGAERPDVDKLLIRTRQINTQLEQELSLGRDRLLEIASYHPGRAAELVRSVRRSQEDPLVRQTADILLDLYSVVTEDAGAGRQALLTEYVTDQAFPLPREERPVITFERPVALEREDVHFVTADHPMITGGLELFLASDNGTSSFALWEDEDSRELLLEACFVAECVGGEGLYADRFFPPQPLVYLIDHKGKDRPKLPFGTPLTNAPIERFMGNSAMVDTVFPRMLAQCEERATVRLGELISKAVEKLLAESAQELERLEELERYNGAGGMDEKARSAARRDALERCYRGARIRLDSLRLIWHGPAPREST